MQQARSRSKSVRSSLAEPTSFTALASTFSEASEPVFLPVFSGFRLCSSARLCRHGHCKTRGMFSLSPAVLERARHGSLIRLARAMGVPLRRQLEDENSLNRLVLVTKIYRALCLERMPRSRESDRSLWYLATPLCRAVQRLVGCPCCSSQHRWISARFYNSESPSGSSRARRSPSARRATEGRDCSDPGRFRARPWVDVRCACARRRHRKTRCL